MRADFEKRMLQGSLQDQYQKLYPKKHQDSIGILNARVKDSLFKVKKRQDSIAGKKPEVKPDTLRKTVP
jgi:penicillin-binding protein 2